MAAIKIEARGVTMAYTDKAGRSLPVLREVTLEVQEGEFVCLLGPSGCGKSTLLNILAGFEMPDQGQVYIDGRPVTGPDPRYLTIFQNYGLFPWRTVQGNVEYGLELKGVPITRRRSLAMEYIRLVGLLPFAHHHPRQLSGGMQQRVALARALAVDPEVIFMDEPFGALDAITRIKMQEELLRIWQQKKKTIVFVTHDIDEAVYLADRVVLFTSNPGRIKTVIPIPISRPRDRSSPDFAALRDQIFTAFQMKQEGKPCEPEYYI
ncbi:nitrate ABC transporter ATP-binding protein [Moorella thermoacetica]|uniref:Aliphatic sulfonates import ATP-binding protein SsuB n=2 Tax=Neomoorella thermoacetica TaxID=1525 RepID=A0A1D7XDC9_NEOTH|nr:ABC transporter ATP-binding protein [Moorella thermoacetica]AKX94799.1 aliphatic sulfonates import ATP-binding protein SsuB [Moorella thermoacetica]AKX97430.1 aliphatic sulfonates import ATP-binding protein SsuB [Moorella thermoacetica]AOQ24935.1 Aliphatic sulfonates import ATP-binding protein SsuB [Moorella thermoacetica]OIQ09005.1 aliphatic sulfonates import ATP-binding protein SsuB [Moorella thermoacetica]OIQ10533.1 aliphatic sulfonates import ATP-binding protein SsuB [Moorella thermoace